MMYLQVAGGLVILLISGELLVRGSVALAEQIGVSKLVIGFTVVALGTSAPELVVCIQAALDGSPGIAFGNVIGSNIANVFLVLGVPALIFPLVSEGPSAIRDCLIMLGGSVAFAAMSWWGHLSRIDGLILVCMLCGIIWFSYYRARSSGLEIADEALEEYEEHMPHSKPLTYGFIIAGLGGLVIGAQLLIDGAVSIAIVAGLSEEVIGLTLVALGTSLPELATSVIAAFRRHGDVAIGNVLGSNLFNITGIIGAATFIKPLEPAYKLLTFDMWVMLAASLILLGIFIIKQPIGRVIGFTFCIFYVAYIFAQFNGFSGLNHTASL
jgi:cation:H+ antiporter